MLRRFGQRFSAALLGALVLPGALRAQDDASVSPPRSQNIFPYSYVDYTQEGHDYRLWNTEVVVLGQIVSLREIEGTQKALDRGVTLRVENFIKMDRPWLQEGKKEISFRCLPLQPPYLDMQVGDRCVVLLKREGDVDDALILPTDYHYYPVTEDGKVLEFFKEIATLDPPVIRELSLSEFVRHLRNELKRISIEEQARNADLVLTGTVRGTDQGRGPAADFLVAEIEVEKIYKGNAEKGVLKLHYLNNMERWVLATLNTPVVREGQRVCVFANKDPTLSLPGPDNPDGQARWTPYNGRQSVWTVHPRTVWRKGAWPIKTDDFFRTIEENAAR